MTSGGGDGRGGGGGGDVSKGLSGDAGGSGGDATRSAPDAMELELSTTLYRVPAGQPPLPANECKFP